MATRLEGMHLGNYELLEHIGTGGMAEVYRARQQNAFGREVAVKVIKRDVAEQPLFYERFLREAQATARLSHPHILPLIELGAVGRKRKLFFLAMPYIPDGTLRDLLARTGEPLPIEVIAPLFMQLCEAVEYAHEQGLIHRDIKPSNVLLQRERYVLLADFGIAFDMEDTRLTSTGVGLGTPEYTAPEQAQGMADKRNDIYSLGVVLFELLAGQVPYKGRTPYEVFYKQTTAPIPLLRDVYPDLPEPLTRLDAVIQKALAKEPAERFQSASALSTAFQAALTEAAIAPVILPAALESKEPLLAGIAGAGIPTSVNNGAITTPDADPLGEQPTNPDIEPVVLAGNTAGYIPAGQPVPPVQPSAARRSRSPLILFSLLALLLLGVAVFVLSAALLNGAGSQNSFNAPHVLPTSSPQKQKTPTAHPTQSPHSNPTSTPTPTPTTTPSPSPTPSPTPSPNPSPTPTPTAPSLLPTPTP